MSSLAVLQEPTVSKLLLEFTLKLVRFKTGIPLRVNRWTVDPFNFSIVFQDIGIRQDNISLRADSLQFQFSPLYLMIGRVHLKSAFLSRANLVSSRRFLNQDSSETKEISYQKIANDIAATFGDVNDSLLQRGLSFEDLVMEELRIEAPEVSAAFREVYFQKLGRTQFRLKTEVERMVLKGRLAPLEKSEISILLMKQSDQEHYLALRDLRLRIYGDQEPQVQASGRFPGDLNFRVNLDTTHLNEYVKSSPSLKDSDPQVFLSGMVKAQGHLKVGTKSIESTSVKVSSRNFKIDIFAPNDVDFIISGSEDRWLIQDLNLDLPRTSWEPPSVMNRISAKELKIHQGKISGQVQVDRAGLCGILLASGVDECYVDLKTSGTIDLDGVTKDFSLLLYPKLQIEAADVYADPKSSRQRESGHLVRTRPGVLEGQFRVQERDLLIEEARVSWGAKAFIDLVGDIKYKPTIVSLKATSGNLPLQEVVDNFVGIPLVGLATSSTLINYRFDSLDPRDKTKVTANLSVADLDILGQKLGELRGTVEFFRKRLRIGPMVLSQGGGLAHILGNLYYKEAVGTWLDLDALLDQYEFGFRTESGAYPVKGGWSGTLGMRGVLGEGSREPFKGPIKLIGKNLESFGIPFEQVDAQGEVGLVYLDIQKLKARKTGSTLSLTGRFQEKGSWVKYSTDRVGLSSLGLFPNFERIFSDGHIIAQGGWDDSGRWDVAAKLSQVRISPQIFDQGDLKVSGSDRGISFDLNLGDANRLSYSTEWSERNLRAKRVQGNLDSRGIYAGLALLNGWVDPHPVRTRGGIEFSWSEQGGFFKTQDLSIFGPKGADASQTVLLQASGTQRISWEGNRSTEGSLNLGGDSQLSIAGIGQPYFQMSGQLSAPLIDLFIPDVVKLRSGVLRMTGAKLFLAPKLKNLRMTSRLEAAEIGIEAIGQPIHKAEATLVIEDSLLKIVSGSGKLGSGAINFEGQYKLDFESEGVLLRSEFERAQIVLLGEYPMTVSGAVNISGSVRPYSLSGNMNVLDGVYSNEFSSFSPSVVVNEKTPDFLFNIRANISDQYFVKNSLINTQIRGTLFVVGDNLAPRLQGVLYLDGGSLFARDNTFGVERGTLSFAQENNNVPIVSLQAETTVRYDSESYKINLLASGRATDLKLDFNSEPALSTQDTISLLTFGFIRSEFESSGTSSQDSGLIQSAGVEAFQAIFGKQIGANINKSTGFNVTLSTKPDSADAEAVPKVEVMRRLGDKTTATFGRSLDLARPENNLQVDYKLLKNLNLTGVWERTQTEEQEDEQSMGADLRFKFDLK